MKTVRIQRKRKSNLTMSVNWFGFLLNHVLRPMAQPYIDQEKAVIQDAKLEKIRTDTRVADQRAASVSNDVVLKDLKIEEQKMKIKLLEHQLRIRGLADGPNVEWTCSHCNRQNTSMVTVCSFCNAPK